jgi:phosphoethanolamine N-methyltransferase
MAERETIFNYWDQFSANPTVETMMLNPNANLVDEMDKKDIMEGLPRNLGTMSVLEIGAGIGRFTEPLARRAKEVHATDFIESFVDKNRELHSEKYPNTSFAVSDAVHMIQSPSSRDLVFTNWLLMYLTDAEVIAFLDNCLQWLRPGGYLHMRESCTESSTRSKSTDITVNPTRYRHVSQYIQLLEKSAWRDPQDGRLWTFKVLWARSVATYIMAKSNWRQCQLLIRKVPADPSLCQEVPTAEESKERLQQVAQQQKEIDADVWAKQKAKTTPTPQEIRLHNELEAIYSPSVRPNVLCVDTDAVNCFRLAEQTDSNVMGLVTDPYIFSALLDVAVKMGDKRVAFTYATYDEESWLLPVLFNVVCGCETLPRCEAGPPQIMACIRKSMAANGRFLFVSKVDTTVLEQLMASLGDVLTVFGSNVQIKDTAPLTPDYSSSSSDDEERSLESRKLKLEQLKIAPVSPSSAATEG